MGKLHSVTPHDCCGGKCPLIAEHDTSCATRVAPVKDMIELQMAHAGWPTGVVTCLVYRTSYVGIMDWVVSHLHMHTRCRLLGGLRA